MASGRVGQGVEEERAPIRDCLGRPSERCIRLPCLPTHSLPMGTPLKTQLVIAARTPHTAANGRAAWLKNLEILGKGKKSWSSMQSIVGFCVQGGCAQNPSSNCRNASSFLDQTPKILDFSPNFGSGSKDGPPNCRGIAAGVAQVPMG